MRVPQIGSYEALYPKLVSEISKIPGRFVFVLDDLHLITETQIHDGLVILLDQLPADQMQLVVASRMDSPSPVARLRAGNEISELRGDKLRFTNEETATS